MTPEALLVFSLELRPTKDVKNVAFRHSLMTAITKVAYSDFEQRLLVVTANEESQFRPEVANCKVRGGIGERGSFQVLPRNYSEAAALCTDLTKSAGIALHRIYESIHQCRHYPEELGLTAYASGKCSNRTGQRISRRRWRLARGRKLLRKTIGSI